MTVAYRHTDVVAAQHAGAKCIAFANKSGEREQFMKYEPAGIVDQMTDLPGAAAAGHG
ncbi:hypothetical protein AB0L13_21400 [Saccharopolyspora shandongensis]|uniref:hypothetical protein n=1 Tax=Saccharopolyspora shandongensis TaxID=418495 RepID=UPI00343C4024